MSAKIPHLEQLSKLFFWVFILRGLPSEIGLNPGGTRETREPREAGLPDRRDGRDRGTGRKDRAGLGSLGCLFLLIVATALFRTLLGAPKRPACVRAIQEWRGCGAVSWTEVEMSIALPECDPPHPALPQAES